MTIRSQEELTGLRRAARVVRETLDVLVAEARPGVTTAELDTLADGVFARHGAFSAPRLVYAFPGTVCISVNDEIVHGIPGSRRLAAGDVLKIDVTAEKDGFVADAARTVLVPPVPEEKEEEREALTACARDAFSEAMEVVRPGARVRDIGRVVESAVSRCGFNVVRELTGHGVGRTIHEEPTVPNYYDHGARQLLHEGLVLAIEPIISGGSGQAFTAADGWTIKTIDGGLAAHHENTVLVTKNGPVLLTA